MSRRVLDRWNVHIESVGQLRASDSEMDGGLELVDDKLYPVENEAAALTMSRRWHASGFIYTARSVPCHVYLYFFDEVGDECSCTMAFDDSLLYFRSEDFNEGQWLTGFLSDMAAGLGADVCGYGADNAYAVKHQALDPQEVLERLRHGDLLQIRNPIFHAFSPRIISREEIATVFDNGPRHLNLRCSVTLSGYSILHALP
ncbi:MAG: hypothetical protein ABJA98_13705 [Acidobacteriota bacterium]